MIADVVKCHVRQADARFSSVVGGSPRTFDEEACAAKARGKIDRAFASFEVNDICTGAATAAATAHVDVLFSVASDPNALEALNARLYCDPTTGVAIDPADADIGTVPSTDDHLKCGDKLGRLVPKLEADVIKCHAKLAKADLALADPPFDYQECEAKALAKLDRGTAGLIAKGICPPCLDAAAQHTLGTDAIARRDAGNGGSYACPDGSLHLGSVQLDRPTLITLGLRVLISGDADHDATVAVRWMEVTEEEEPINMQSFKDALVKKEKKHGALATRRANTEKKDGAAGPD